MPLYEYQCEECGVRFERQQSFKDEPLTKCPECEGKVHRVIGATGIIFKGSGFYVNDSKTKNSAAIPADSKVGDKTEKNDSAPSTEAKTDSKTETKAETKTEAKPTLSASAS